MTALQGCLEWADEGQRLMVSVLDSSGVMICGLGVPRSQSAVSDLNCGGADSQGYIDEHRLITRRKQRNTNEGATRQDGDTQNLEYEVRQSSDAIILHWLR
jgi:hypothetical protein